MFVQNVCSTHITLYNTFALVGFLLECFSRFYIGKRLCIDTL